MEYITMRIDYQTPQTSNSNTSEKDNASNKVEGNYFAPVKVKLSFFEAIQDLVSKLVGNNSKYKESANKLTNLINEKIEFAVKQSRDVLYQQSPEDLQFLMKSSKSIPKIIKNISESTELDKVADQVVEHLRYKTSDFIENSNDPRALPMWKDDIYSSYLKNHSPSA
jgi:hypothetical protein